MSDYVTRKEFDELKKMVKEIHSFLNEPERVGDRSVMDDLKLLRTIYHRFTGAKFMIGVIIGVLGALAPFAIAFFKIYQLITIKGG
jgi:hypothetical protein